MWLKAKSLLRSATKEDDAIAADALAQYIHHLSVQNQILQQQLDGAQEALTEKKKMKDKQRVLPLYAHNIEWHGGAKWWSPSSKREADARMDAQQRYEEEIEAAKATQRELQHTQKLLKQKEKEDNRLRREREKEERDRLKAVKAAEAAKRKAQRERDKQACDAKKAVQLPQRDKRKASQVAAPRKKQKRGGAAACSRRVVHERSPSPPPTYNSRGRKIAPRKKYEWESVSRRPI